MTKLSRASLMAIALALVSVPALAQQQVLEGVLLRHGVGLPERGIEGAFDDGLAPVVPVTPGSFAGPLATLATGGRDRIAAAYTFGILAGRSGRGAAPGEVAAAGQALLQMIASEDRRSRIVGARVAGRIFAVPLDGAAVNPPVPGLVDALFGLLNQSNETELLAAMDAIGLMRERSAVPSLTERYHFYRDGKKRALAGGALEALARIGDPSSIDIARTLAGDKWGIGKDATALAVSFARQRLLKDGSIADIHKALDDKALRAQARGYLTELGAPSP
jgi:hypothetical protein